MTGTNSATGEDSSPSTRPIYCYIVRQIDVDDAPTLYLTQYDGSVDISGLPAVYAADAVQEFVAANISHGTIRRESNFDKQVFEIRALTRDLSGISRYALTGAVPRIRIDVVKVNAGPVVAGTVAEWGSDTLLVQSGILASFSFEGYNVAAECVPAALFSGQEVPRCRFSRVCNHQLYGPACGLSKAAFSLVTNVVAIDVANRQLTVQGTHGDDAGDFFRQGVLEHQPTGMRLSVFKSAIAGTDTLVALQQWAPDINVGDVVTVVAGCRHTFDDCLNKFANAPNFGGFSQVPNKNPTIHGV